MLMANDSPDGKRIRRKVSGKTKQEVRDKLRELHADLAVGLQPMSGYTVQAAVDAWLDHGLSGRSARTVQLYRDGIQRSRVWGGAGFILVPHREGKVPPLLLPSPSTALIRADHRPVQLGACRGWLPVGREVVGSW